MKKTLFSVLVIVMMMVLCLPVMADAFVGSAEAKPAPAVKEATVNGETASVSTIAYGDKASASSAAKSSLESAYNSIKNGKLDTAANGTTSCDNIFYIKSDKSVNITKPMTVKLGTSYKDKPDVAVYADGEWTVLNADDVTLNADGTLTLKLTTLGTVATFSTTPYAYEKPSTTAYVVLWSCVGALYVIFAVCFIILLVRRRKV